MYVCMYVCVYVYTYWGWIVGEDWFLGLFPLFTLFLHVLVNLHMFVCPQRPSLGKELVDPALAALQKGLI